MNLIELINIIDNKNQILHVNVNYFNQLTHENELDISINNLFQSYELILSKFNLPITINKDDFLELMYDPKIGVNQDANTIQYYTFYKHLKYLNKYFKVLHFDSTESFTINKKIYNLSNQMIFHILFTFIDMVAITCVILTNYDVYNWYLLLARGTAITFLINIFFILCQYSDISNSIPIEILQYFPYSDKLLFHKIFAIKSICYAIIHSILHILDIYYILNLCKDGCTYSQVPLIIEKQTTSIIINFSYFNLMLPFITGYMLIIIMFSLVVMAIKYHYYGRPAIMLFTHRIISIILFILIMIHGSKQILGFNFSYIFVFPLFIIYLFFRISEFITYKKLKIINWDITHKNIITLWLYVSNNYLDQYHLYTNSIYPSCALFININKISIFEFHPFTISTGFTLNEIVININIIGKWTKTLKSFLQNSQQLVNNEFYISYGRYKLSAFRFYTLYKTNIFICSNLGITPYISLMRDIILNHKNYDFNNYFIWSVNSIDMINVISNVLNEIQLNPLLKHIKIYIYYSNKNNIPSMQLTDKDILSFYYIQTLIHKRYNIDIISNNILCSPIILGRVNLSSIIKTLINNSDNNSKIGVFACGSKRYCALVKSQIHTYQYNSKNIKLDVFLDEGLD
jgi:predicted ferric reductase